MAKITAIPELVTSPADTNFELTISSPILESFELASTTVTIEVVTGTWSFNVGATAANSSASYAAGEKAVVTISDEFKLNCIAANASETFKISF